MAIWDLAQIRQKVREVTGRFSEDELPTTELDTRINQYYQYTFPAEVKLDKQLKFAEFLTVPNQPTYAEPAGFTNFVAPATIDEYEMFWYQDPIRFREDNWKQISRLTPWTGDGVTSSFSTTVTGFPIYPDTTVITDNVETFEDTNTTFANSPVTITGDLGGNASVNYSTGAISVNFFTPPANGQDIYLSYSLFAAKRPQSVLYYDSIFEFFPVPDTAYRFKCQAYAEVAALTLATDQPPLNQWGPCIAYGTARDIHANFGEMEAYAEVTALYKEQVRYVMARTDQNLLNTRAAPHF